ncbi:ATP-binding protein [Pseudonocardia sp.]|uniref:ATP-binding protein n=1 Tax=Pseudonocardia sp. TaxID=60912 RepID=UPI002603FCD4|nr:ATP-binding protein [Pseudonocardia sp.]
MNSPAPTTAPGPAVTPPLVRRRSGRFVAGVAGGVADHLGVDVLWVRAGFVVLTAISGAGAMAYGLLWIFVRQDRSDTARLPGRRERQQAYGLVALGIGAGIAASTFGDSVAGWIVGPLGVAAVGAAVVWREADESQRRRWTEGARSGITGLSGGGRSALLRVTAGAVFVTAGIGVFLIGNLQLGQVQFALLAVLATLVGVAVITVPWWVKLVRDLGEERRERIVEAERAEIAAHLHDSVLQTLALIQRQSDQPREVLRLARGQERELRHWLYGPAGYGRSGAADPGLDAGLAAAITTAAAEVEDTYAIDIRPVVVGDHSLDDGLRALVLAAREAMVNAAKHAKVSEASVYVEVEPGEVHVFVRDRGVGFDPDDIPDDRHGLADSVHGRMARHGGTVRLRSTAGEGTEVQLRMPVEDLTPDQPTPGDTRTDHTSADQPAPADRDQEASP